MIQLIIIGMLSMNIIEASAGSASISAQLPPTRQCPKNMWNWTRAQMIKQKSVCLGTFEKYGTYTKSSRNMFYYNFDAEKRTHNIQYFKRQGQSWIPQGTITNIQQDLFTQCHKKLVKSVNQRDFKLIIAGEDQYGKKRKLTLKLANNNERDWLQYMIVSLMQYYEHGIALRDNNAKVYKKSNRVWVMLNSGTLDNPVFIFKKGTIVKGDGCTTMSKYECEVSVDAEDDKIVRVRNTFLRHIVYKKNDKVHIAVNVKSNNEIQTGTVVARQSDGKYEILFDEGLHEGHVAPADAWFLWPIDSTPEHSQSVFNTRPRASATSRPRSSVNVTRLSRNSVSSSRSTLSSSRKSRSKSLITGDETTRKPCETKTRPRSKTWHSNSSRSTRSRSTGSRHRKRSKTSTTRTRAFTM